MPGSMLYWYSDKWNNLYSGNLTFKNVCTKLDCSGPKSYLAYLLKMEILGFPIRRMELKFLALSPRSWPVCLLNPLSQCLCLYCVVCLKRYPPLAITLPTHPSQFCSNATSSSICSWSSMFPVELIPSFSDSLCTLYPFLLVYTSASLTGLGALPTETGPRSPLQPVPSTGLVWSGWSGNIYQIMHGKIVKLPDKVGNVCSQRQARVKKIHLNSSCCQYSDSTQSNAPNCRVVASHIILKFPTSCFQLWFISSKPM